MKKLEADPILGFTHNEIVMLDFDDMSFKSVKYWTSLAIKRFELNGFIILKSNKNHYHVVFDRYVSWEDNVSVIAWVAILSKSVSMLRYLAMQCIKKSSTLRVVERENKPNPRVVFKFGMQDNAIKEFLKERQLIKRIDRNS